MRLHGPWLDDCLEIAKAGKLGKLGEITLPRHLPAIVVDEISFPAALCENFLGWKADFLLPLASAKPLVWSPFLKDPKCALRSTCNDIVRIFREPGFHLPILIGSSGVGKTTTAFLVCQQMFCFYLELNPKSVNRGFFLGCELFDNCSPDDIRRRILREVGKRALVLAQLWKLSRGNLTPYDWLLYQFGEEYDRIMGTLKRLSFEDYVWRGVVDEVAGLVGGELAVILDEAHLIGWTSKLDVRKLDVHTEGGESPLKETSDPQLTAFQIMLWALTSTKLRGVLSLGTQVGLSQAGRVPSLVSKLESGLVRAYFVGQYPVLRPSWEKQDSKWPCTVRQSLEACIRLDSSCEEFVGFLEGQLNGRCRFVATFVQWFLVQDPKMSVFDRLRAAWSRHDGEGRNRRWSLLVSEIERGVEYSFPRKLDVEGHVTLWGKCMFDPAEASHELKNVFGGTLVCTQGVFIPDRNAKFTTGYEVVGPGEKAEFVYWLGESALMEALQEYVISRSGELRFFERVWSCCLREIRCSNPSIRGFGLDNVALMRVCFECRRVKRSLSLSEFFVPNRPEGRATELFPANDTRMFEVLEIRGGKGMLLLWLEMVLTVPDECANGTEFNGAALKWRQLAVRPEPLSGADGAFAAFDRVTGEVTIVLFANAWYSAGVPAAKVDKQMRTGDLDDQFANRAAGAARSRKALLELLNGRPHKSLCVMVELPSRKGAQPENNVDNGCFVIDERNCEEVLGIPTSHVRGGGGLDYRGPDSTASEEDDAANAKPKKNPPKARRKKKRAAKGKGKKKRSLKAKAK
jgi:hypothetical protein